MPFLQFTSEENLKKSLPSDIIQIHITSLTEKVNLKSLYIRANVFRKFKLNKCRVPSIKLILQEDNGSAICFHGFGNIATQLDSCSVGDTLFLLTFEVEIAPKQSHLSSKFQLLADDRTVVKPIIWLLRNNLDGSSQGGNSRGKAAVPKESYVYTLLNDLKVGEKVNVYGVITHMKEMSHTRGKDKHLMLNITDQSMPSKDCVLTCNLFHADSERLPAQAQVGDVIRFHRLKIQNYVNKLQGINGPGFHWLFFQGSFDNVSSSSSNYTLDTQDKEKVQALLEWSQSNANEIQTILDDIEPPSDEDDMTTSTSSMSSNPVPSTSRDDDSRKSEKRISSKVSSSSTYQRLRDIKVGTEVNVFGVVSYLKPLVTTKLSQFHQMMNITDQSFLSKDDKLTCNLFNTDQDKLPYLAEVGDVIRLKDLKIRLFQGKKQGSGTVGWALFRDSSEQPLYSSDGFIPDVQEKAVVASLRKWWQEGPESISFSQSTPRKYFNIVCQVIGVYLELNKTCRVIRVWDGTAFKGPIMKRTDAEMNHEMRKDSYLEALAGELATDLFLFDNHVSSSDIIKPGDVIKVTNLHANLVSARVEMTLHGGTKFNKGFALLDRHSPEAKKLLEALNSFSPQQDEFTSPQKKNPSKRYLDGRQQPDDGPSSGKKFCKKKNADGRNVPGESLDDSVNWCDINEAELALAKEYDNIPEDAELSQRDRFAIEAYLAKHKTLSDDSSSKNKASDQAGSSKEVEADKSHKPSSSSSSSSRGDRKDSVNVNDNCNKRSDQDCDIIEGSSGSSSEASPSIWLSLYNSPASLDGQEASIKESKNEEDSPKFSCPLGYGEGISQPVGTNNSQDSKDEPSNINISLALFKSGTLKTKGSVQSEAPITKDKSNNRNTPRKRIQGDIEEHSVSSQDSFITASEGISPRRKRVSPCDNLAGTSTSSEKSPKPLLTLKSSKSKLSQDSLQDASGLDESDNTISSSLDCQSSNSKGDGEVHEESQVSSSTDSKRNEQMKDSRDTLSDDEPLQCMLETATVVLDHPIVKRTKLREVYHHKVPHKFKILVRMLDYKPKPTCAGDLVHFCCHICNYMIKASDIQAPALMNQQKICSKCTTKDSVLQPVIIMNFLLSDGKYDLICHLWKSHAAQFFQGMEPLDLLANEDCFTEVQHHLDQLCPENTDFKDKPLMECCIFSYYVKKEVHYQMFDTVVV